VSLQRKHGQAHFSIGKRPSGCGQYLTIKKGGNLGVGDHPFPITSQSVIELETVEGALLRRAGKESQMAEEATGDLPRRRLWISILLVGGRGSYQQ
jgi:hypothetical protein